MQTLDYQERILASLRSLYNCYGYRPYRMNKFEEYDLYARNKDFLISDSIITFTDRSGKLMALKPDVTLSIVKNTADTGSVQKLYYNENVYRVSKGSGVFREMLQVGLECLGRIDDYAIFEVLLLAAKSLLSISQLCVLDISHLALVTQLLDAMAIPRETHSAVFSLMSEKNLHGLQALCQEAAIQETHIAALQELLSISGPICQTLPRLEKLMENYPTVTAFSSFRKLLAALLEEDMGQVFCIDFSVVDDVHYYNGVVFKGFVNGVPSSVLSGGQYDRLMKKMGRSSGAIGFAVYTDALERLWEIPNSYDAETVLLYPENAPLQAVTQKVRQLTEQGLHVLALPQVPEDLRYQQLLKLEVNDLANHA